LASLPPFSNQLEKVIEEKDNDFWLVVVFANSDGPSTVRTSLDGLSKGGARVGELVAFQLGPKARNVDVGDFGPTSGL
jgi:hypothetical protein